MTQAATSQQEFDASRGESDSSSRADDAQHESESISLQPWVAAKFFAIVITVLIVVGASANYAVYNVAPHPDHPVADVLKRFDLGHEPSIPAFYSAAAMVASAGLLFFLGRRDRAQSRRPAWYALSILFLLLAIDEAVMFHEMVDTAMNRLNLGRMFYFSWVIPGFIFAAVVGLAFLKFLLSLPHRTRNLLILSGVVFLAGAIGMEIIAGLIFDAAASEEAAVGSIAHVIVQAIEEGLEMTGVAIFFCALIDYTHQSGLRLEIRHDSSRQVT